MMLVSTPTKPSPYYQRHCTPPRFASDSSPFDSSPVLTPSPLRQRQLFPANATPMHDIDDLFTQSPYRSMPQSHSASKPQPILADDEEGAIFLSGPSSASPPLLTPIRQGHRPHLRNTLSVKQTLNAGLSPIAPLQSAGFDSSTRSGHNLTPLKLTPSVLIEDREKSSFLFDRLPPLPTPKTTTRTPQTKAETEAYLRRQTDTLTRLRISDRDDSADEYNNDSGCELDEDALFLCNARMKSKVGGLGKSTGRLSVNKGKSKEEIAEAISPGGHITKRRARSRPLSTELKQSVRPPKSPSRVVTCTNSTRPKPRSSVSFPSTRARTSSSSSSECGSPLPRRRINTAATKVPIPVKLPGMPLPPRPPLSRDSLSSATLFFGPPIPQSPAPSIVRERTNTLTSTIVPASTKSKTNRHSYAGPAADSSSHNAWSTMQTRMPSPGSSPNNGEGLVSTDVDDMDFEDGPPNSSFVLNITPHSLSPPFKTALQTKYKPRDSGVVVSDDDGSMFFSNNGRNSSFFITPSSTSVNSVFSDEGLVTPGVAPDFNSGWPDANVFVRGTDDNGRAIYGNPSSGVDVDAFIMNTLASAGNGPHEVTKRIPGTPVKKVRTTYLGNDRPWQSAVATKVAARLDYDDKKKAPRKSLPAVFPGLSRHCDRATESTDSEGEQDSPSNRKYGDLGIGRPQATPRDVPLALTRTRWLMRRSSSGAFSSGSESASITNTPTRGKTLDWHLPKPRIPGMYSDPQQRSTSGSSNGSTSTTTVSPLTRTRYRSMSGARRPVPRMRSSFELHADDDYGKGKFEREFVELSEVGSGEFGKVIKACRKNGSGSEEFAIKKSKRIEGMKHRLRLREEVDILSHLSQEAFKAGLNGRHPNVLAYIDSWEEREVLYIQTELCESGNLAWFLWEYGKVFPRLDEARVWKIIADLSNGLSFIHDAKVIHLDLKPSNVFLTKEGRFKIGDFGMASMWPRVATDTAGRGFEREGDKLYLAPEILQGQYGMAADVFSLGMTILETTSNIVVPDQGEAWHRLRREDFSQVDLQEESGELVALIKQMMRTDPQTRISAHGICKHAVVERARCSMERMAAEARRTGKSEFAGSPLASVPPGFLNEILGLGRDGWEMDMSL